MEYKKRNKASIINMYAVNKKAVINWISVIKLLAPLRGPKLDIAEL